MSLRDDARLAIAAYAPADEQQRSLRDDYLAFIDEHDDATWRECDDGHVTASALVIDPVGERVLLTLHPKVGRWLQMGGHCEPGDASLRAAAAREAREESGIDGLVLSEAPVRLDRHGLFCQPGRYLNHLDVQYVAVAGPDACEVASEESLDLAWFGVDDLPPDTDQSVRALVAAAISHLR